MLLELGHTTLKWFRIGLMFVLGLEYCSFKGGGSLSRLQIRCWSLIQGCVASWEGQGKTVCVKGEALPRRRNTEVAEAWETHGEWEVFGCFSGKGKGELDA